MSPRPRSRVPGMAAPGRAPRSKLNVPRVNLRLHNVDLELVTTTDGKSLVLGPAALFVEIPLDHAGAIALGAALQADEEHGPAIWTPPGAGGLLVPR